jgi:hypothetical protein
MGDRYASGCLGTSWLGTTSFGDESCRRVLWFLKVGRHRLRFDILRDAEPHGCAAVPLQVFGGRLIPADVDRG